MAEHIESRVGKKININFEVLIGVRCSLTCLLCAVKELKQMKFVAEAVIISDDQFTVKNTWIPRKLRDLDQWLIIWW